MTGVVPEVVPLGGFRESLAAAPFLTLFGEGRPCDMNRDPLLAQTSPPAGRFLYMCEQAIKTQDMRAMCIVTCCHDDRSTGHHACSVSGCQTFDKVILAITTQAQTDQQTGPQTDRQAYLQ